MSLGKIRKVSSSLSVGDKTYPVADYSMALQMDALPQAQFTIAMGVGWTKKGGLGEQIDLSGIKAGDKVLFTLKVGSFRTTFKGTVTSAMVAVRTSQQSGSSGKFVIKAENELGRLGGLSVLQRAFSGSGTPAAGAIDSYRNMLGGGKKNANFVKSMMGDGSAIKAFDNITDKTKGAPQAVIKTMIALYESESYSPSTAPGGKGYRSSDDVAVALLQKLLGRVWGGQVNFSSAGDKQKVISAFFNKTYENMLKRWPKANGLSTLISSLNDMFYSLAPTLEGEVDVRHNCPVLSTADASIANADILNIRSSTAFEFNPIAGIRIFIPTTPGEKTNEGDRTSYAQYPEKLGKEVGLYEYIDTDRYAMWFLFQPLFTHKKNGKKTKGVLSTTNSKGKKIVEKKDEDAKPISPEGKARYFMEVGKALYAQRKWRSGAIVIEVAHNNGAQVGDIVKLDFSKDTKALAAGIPLGIYIGAVDNITLSGSGTNASMLLTIKSVRSDQDNKLYGLKERPLYANYPKPKK